MIVNFFLSAVLIAISALGWGVVLYRGASKIGSTALVILTLSTVVSSAASATVLILGISEPSEVHSSFLLAVVFVLAQAVSLVLGYFLSQGAGMEKAVVRGKKLFGFEKKVLDRSEIIEEILERREQTGDINDVERELLESVLKFNDKTVREVMIPRGDMVALNLDESPKRVLRKVIEEGYSRLPVYRISIDNIVGIIYAKDLLAMVEDSATIVLQDLLRNPFYVPETKKISDLLREMQRNKVHLAIVVDEFGGTEGIITMEDILEEIVGEIQDEYDESQQELVYDESGSVHFSGLMHVERFNELLNMSVPKEDDYDTMAGFVQKLAGKLPQKGETYSYEEMFFSVEDLARHRIKRLKVSFKEHPSVESKSEVIVEESPVPPSTEEVSGAEVASGGSGQGNRVRPPKVAQPKKRARQTASSKKRRKKD